MITRILLACLSLVNAGTGFSQVTIKKPSESTPSKAIIHSTSDGRTKNISRLTAYDFSGVQFCVEEYQNVNIPAKTSGQSYNQLPRVLSDGSLTENNRLRQGLTSLTNEMWSTGDVITVGFYADETTPFVIKKVKEYAAEWMQHANVKFSFIDDVNAAQVRVGFQKGPSWSWLGRQVLVNPAGQRTMNFGWFTNETTDAEFSRVTLHEFGHALGLVHEHQSPAAGIPWDKEKVYAYFGGPPNNWNRATVDAFIFARYSASSTNYSAYDPLSIMHYPFPADLTTNNVGVNYNNFLSATDKYFARLIYPFPPEPPKGILRTGDDCDEIVFLIEYNAVNKGVIEFILEPGIDNGGNKVSWWKQIGIPLKGGGQANLELHPDGRTDTRTLQVMIVDSTRPLTFAKAKAFGIHTGLGYTWNVLPAIVGGTRVRLTWRNDHCY